MREIINVKAEDMRVGDVFIYRYFLGNRMSELRRMPVRSLRLTPRQVAINGGAFTKYHASTVSIERDETTGQQS